MQGRDIKSMTETNKLNILNKIGYYDMMLDSLGKVHESHQAKVGELVKQFSDRKITLMEELHRLLS